MICPSCGYKIEVKKDTNFCGNCGINLKNIIRTQKRDHAPSPHNHLIQKNKDSRLEVSSTDFLRVDICPYCKIEMQRGQELKSEFGPLSLNSLGRPIGITKEIGYYTCPRCKFKRYIS